nr:TPA: hypothetical protein BN1204_046600 [Neospora caninum Liverpool]
MAWMGRRGGCERLAGSASPPVLSLDLPESSMDLPASPACAASPRLALLSSSPVSGASPLFSPVSVSRPRSPRLVSSRGWPRWEAGRDLSACIADALPSPGPHSADVEETRRAPSFLFAPVHASSPLSRTEDKEDDGVQFFLACDEDEDETSPATLPDLPQGHVLQEAARASASLPSSPRPPFAPSTHFDASPASSLVPNANAGGARPRGDLSHVPVPCGATYAPRGDSAQPSSPFASFGQPGGSVGPAQVSVHSVRDGRRPGGADPKAPHGQALAMAHASVPPAAAGAFFEGPPAGDNAEGSVPRPSFGLNGHGRGAAGESREGKAYSALQAQNEGSYSAFSFGKPAGANPSDDPPFAASAEHTSPSPSAPQPRPSHQLLSGFPSSGPTFVLGPGPDEKQWRGPEGSTFRPPEDGSRPPCLPQSADAPSRLAALSFPALAKGPGSRGDTPSQLGPPGSPAPAASPRVFAASSLGRESAPRPELSQAAVEKPRADPTGRRPCSSAPPLPAVSASGLPAGPQDRSPGGSEAARFASATAPGVSALSGPAALPPAARSPGGPQGPPDDSGPTSLKLGGRGGVKSPVASRPPGPLSANLQTSSPTGASDAVSGKIPQPAPRGNGLPKMVGGSHAHASTGKKGPLGVPGAGPAGLPAPGGGVAPAGVGRPFAQGVAHADRPGLGADAFPIFRRVPRTVDEAVVAHAVSAAAAVEKQSVWPVLGLLSPAVGAPRVDVKGPEGEDGNRTKARVAAFETELPAMDWLPSIPRLLHVFDYIAPPILQKCLSEEPGSGGSSAGRARGSGDSSSAALALKPAGARPDGDDKPTPPASLPADETKREGTSEKAEVSPVPGAPVFAASACLPPAFPPPVSSLLAPPQPPTGGFGRGPFPPSSSIASMALLAGAVDPGCLFSGTSRRQGGLSSKPRPHIHSLLHPRGCKHRGLERDGPLGFREPAKGHAAVKGACGAFDERSAGDVEYTRGDKQPEVWTASRPLLPPERRLTVISLDVKRACGPVLFEHLRRKLERQAEAERAQEGTASPPGAKEGDVQKSSKAEQDCRKVPTGKDGADVKESGDEGMPVRPGGDSNPASGPEKASADRSGSGGRSSSFKASGTSIANRRPAIPSPEEMLWNIADWHEAVDALCVAWLADAGLPPVLSLPHSPPSSTSSTSFWSLSSSLSPYLLRQPVSCLSVLPKLAEDCLRAPPSGGSASAEPATVSAGASRKPEDHGEGAEAPSERAVGSSAGAQPRKGSDGEKADERAKTRNPEDPGEVEWVLALAEILAADVRRQLAGAAEREIDFTCLVQMADALQRDDTQQRQLVGLQLAGPGREGEPGDSRAQRRTPGGVEDQGSPAGMGRGDSSTPSPSMARQQSDTVLATPTDSWSSLSGPSATPSRCSLSSLASLSVGSSAPKDDLCASPGASAASSTACQAPACAQPSSSQTPPLGASTGRLLSSVPSALSVRLASLLSAFTCIIEIDVQDTESETRIDDRFYWNLRHGDGAVLAYCQQLGVDCSLSPCLVSLYRLAFHRSIERRRQELLSEYKTQLKSFNRTRGLGSPLVTRRGNGPPTSLDSRGEKRAASREVGFGGGRLFYRLDRSLEDGGCSISPGARLLLPWSTSLVSFRRTAPTGQRPFLPLSPRATPRAPLLPHTFLERLPDPLLASAAAGSSPLTQAVPSQNGASGAEADSASFSGGGDKGTRKSALLFEREDRQHDGFEQGGAADFGPLVFRGPAAALWPGRKVGQKRRRR